jgi:hypothetical protein
MDPNRAVVDGLTKYVAAYRSTALATAPAIDPSPPMTGTARTASERAGLNWLTDTLRQASAHRTPDAAATNPDSASAASFTVAGVMPNAAAAASLSRTASTTRPPTDRRSALAAMATSASATRAT